MDSAIVIQTCSWDEDTACQVQELLRRVFVDGGYTSAQFAEQSFTVPALVARGLTFVARDADQAVVGMAMLVANSTRRGPGGDVTPDDEGQLHLLAVDAACRGRGLAERLIATVECAAIERGLQRMLLSTQPGMLAAHRCYARAGYSRLPERDWSRHDKSYWVMHKRLTLTPASPERAQ